MLKWWPHNKKHIVFSSFLREYQFNLHFVANMEFIHPVGSVSWVSLISLVILGIFANAQVLGGLTFHKKMLSDTASAHLQSRKINTHSRPKLAIPQLIVESVEKRIVLRTSFSKMISKGELNSESTFLISLMNMIPSRLKLIFSDESTFFTRDKVNQQM